MNRMRIHTFMTSLPKEIVSGKNNFSLYLTISPESEFVPSPLLILLVTGNEQYGSVSFWRDVLCDCVNTLPLLTMEFAMKSLTRRMHAIVRL